MSSLRRALVTGATGQTGSYMVDHLLAHDYQVYALVRRTSTPGMSRLAHVLSRIEVVNGDLTDSPSLERLLHTVMPQEVYNFAAQSHVGTSFDQALHTADVTGIGALRLFEAIRMVVPHARVFQASSSEQFGNLPAPQSEDTPFAPISPYGCAKAFAHHCAQVYRSCYGIPITCGISFNHESERRGEQFVTRKITHTIGRILRGEATELRLGRLTTRRDWMHAEDVARGAWLAVQAPEPTDYVFASGESHTVQEFVDLAFAHAGLDASQYVRQDQTLVRPSDPLELRGDAGKARRCLGWVPTVPFPTLVQRMVDYDRLPH